MPDIVITYCGKASAGLIASPVLRPVNSGPVHLPSRLRNLCDRVCCAVVYVIGTTGFQWDDVHVWREESVGRCRGLWVYWRKFFYRSAQFHTPFSQMAPCSLCKLHFRFFTQGAVTQPTTRTQAQYR